jgi:precorrin-2 dehydrogenase/sirohydrochlorin ferrochelatase
VLPIVLDCADWPILLAGAGEPASRRLATLDAAGCRHVVVFGPPADRALRDAAGDRFRAGLPGEDVIAVQRLLLLAGLSPRDSAALAALARRHRVLVNAGDAPSLCDFHLPAMVRRGALLLTASTGGTSPALAARLRAWLEARFGPEWGERVARAARLRAELRDEGRNAEIGPAVNALADREAWFDEPAGR